MDDEVVDWLLWAITHPEEALAQLEQEAESPKVKEWLDEETP